MSLEIGGASTGSTYPSWWDEEERKRRERLGIPGAPIEPVKQQTPEQQWKQQERDYANNPRSVIDSDAQQAIKYLSDFNGPEGKQMGSVEEYFKLANNMGEDKLRDRIQAIKYVWDTFLPNVDGTSAVWELVKSPYDLQQITAMAREGALSDFARQKDREKAKYDLGMSYFGYDQMMAKHYVTYGDQTVSPTQRLGQFASENPVEALMLAANILSFAVSGPTLPLLTKVGATSTRLGYLGSALPAAAKVGGILRKMVNYGGVIGGTGAVMQEQASAVRGARAEQARENKPTLDTGSEEAEFLQTVTFRPFLNDEDPLAKSIDEIQAINSIVYGANLEQEDLDTLKSWLTTELTDPYTGQVILPAESIDDLDSGYITYEVANALLSRASKIRNQEFDFKVELIERGFQTNSAADLSLPLKSDAWKPAVDRYNQHMIEQTKAWERYPLEAAFRDARGYEWTKEGRAAAREALLATGLLNVPFNYGFQLISDAGGVQEAIGARAEFVTRANRDEAYQHAHSALVGYVIEKYMGEGNKYSDYQPWEPSHVNQVTDLVRLELLERKSEFETDAELMRLNEALAKEEMRLIKGDEGYFGKDYIATMARVFNIDPQGWEKMRREHPEVVSVTNLFMDVSASFATPPLWRAMKGGAVEGSAFAFLQDSRAAARLQQAAGHIDDGNIQAAIQVLGGTQSAKNVVLGTHKWATAVKSPHAFTDITAEIVKLAQKGDDKAIAKMLVGERADVVAARIGEYVRTKGESPRSLAFFERQVEPAEPYGVQKTERVVVRGGGRQIAWWKTSDGSDPRYTVDVSSLKAMEPNPKVAATADDIARAKDALLRGESLTVRVSGSTKTQVGLVIGKGYARAAEELGLKRVPVAVQPGSTTGKSIIGKRYKRPADGDQMDWVRRPEDAFPETFQKYKKGLSKETQPSDFVMPVSRKVQTAGTNWGPVPMPSGAEALEAAIKGKVSKWLANEQAKHGTVFGVKPVEEALKVQAAYAWTTGKNILPELRFAKLNEPLNLKVAIDAAIAKIKNKYLRKTLSEMTKWYHREPQDVVDLSGPEAAEIVHDWVLIVSGDAKVARDWAAEAMRVTDTAALRTFETKLIKMADSYLERRKVVPSLVKGDGGAESVMGLSPKVGSNGKVLTYKDRATGEKLQVPTDTAQTKYTLNLGKDVMWAPYKLGKIDQEAALLVRGMQQTHNLVLQARNAWRTTTRAVYNVNAPLRNIAVGAGAPVLFMKHLIADSPRAFLDGVPIFNLKAQAARFAQNLKKAGSEAAEYVRYMRHESEFTTQHYLSSVDAEWQESTVFGKSRNPAKNMLYGDGRVPQNLEYVADSLRRAGQSKVFKAWAKGGMEAARKWYLSAEGKAWMKQEGYYKAVRSNRSGPLPKGKALDEAVADWAMSEYVVGYLEELRAAAPHLLDGYDDVAGLIKLSQDGKLDTGEIGKVIKAVAKREPSENLRLGVQKDLGAGGNLANRLTKPFIGGVKKAMIPDRFVRTTTFDHVFNQAFKRMEKEGVDSGTAARTAAEIAYARSEQIHFDMSRAMEWETKYRGFAWFLADSRIYLQYWLRTIASRPTLAGAVKDFENWMEERNKNLDVPEYQRHNITVGVGNGNYFTVDPAVYFWFTVYSAEALAGHGLERAGLGLTNAVLGTAIKPAPMDFGANITRFDEIAKAMFHVVKSPIGFRGFVPFQDVAKWNIPEEEWQKWFEEQTPAYREKMSRETHKRMALAELNGKPITWSDAIAQVLVSNLARQSYRFLRPSSTRLITAGEIEYNKLMTQLSEAKTPEAKEALIDQNPALLNIMGIGTDPWVKDELDDYRTQYFAAQDKLAADIDRLFDEGRIMDKEAVDAAYKEFEAIRDKLKGESEVFRDWMTASRTEELEAALGYIMPGTDAEMFIRQNQPPDAERKLYVEQVSQANFDEALKKYGVSSDDTDSPLYKLLKDFYVTQPRNAMLGVEDEMTRREVSVARFLGRGGEAGVFRKDKYLQMVRDQHMRELVGAGTSGAKADLNNPMMSRLTVGDKEAMGWNTDPKAEEGWWQWAVQHHKYSKIIKEQVPGGSKGSKAGKAVWAQFEAWVEKYKGENPGWAKEYEFSAKPLLDRLRDLGIGEGTDDLSQGWNGFFDLATEYRESLGALGVNSGTITSAEVDVYYTSRLASYAREHEEWWRHFRNTYTLSKFGWVKRLEGSEDDFLWESEDAEGVS